MIEPIDKPLRVGCVCGKWLPTTSSAAGTAITCPCGYRVQVPLLEEFAFQPDLLSAATFEGRIKRLVAAGELPYSTQCLECAETTATQEVGVVLECEVASMHVEGGARFIYIPFLFLATWHEEERVEVHGNDTVVPAPICLCEKCLLDIRARRKAWNRWAPMPYIFAIAFIGLFFVTVAFVLNLVLTLIGLIFLGLVFAALSTVGLALWRERVQNARQKILKDLLRQVPVFRQILQEYPYAMVIFPKANEKIA